jgi:hypothetical protein
MEPLRQPRSTHEPAQTPLSPSESFDQPAQEKEAIYRNESAQTVEMAFPQLSKITSLRPRGIGLHRRAFFVIRM